MAQRFNIVDSGAYKLVYIFGNKTSHDTTKIFALSRDTLRLKHLPAHYQRIKIPCTRIVALSSIYAAMLNELGTSASIVAVDNGDYLIDQRLKKLIETKKIIEVAKGPEPDVERIVLLNPDIVFTFGMGNGIGDLPMTLQRSKLPIVVSIDHLEQTPLARAEWLKLFAAFVDKDSLAHTIYTAVKNRYLKLCDSASIFQTKPTVFTEIKVGDAWYMPGGRSFMAHLLADAKSNYVLADDKHTGSVAMSFEQVYVKAKQADYWLNLPLIKTKSDLTGLDMRYSHFKAFKTGLLYNNDKVVNNLGYSAYWESGMFHPERILSDLIMIFHNKGQVRVQDLYYYRKIE